MAMRRARIKPAAIIPTKRRPPNNEKSTKNAIETATKSPKVASSPIKTIQSPKNIVASPVKNLDPPNSSNETNGNIEIKEKPHRRRTMKPTVNIPCKKSKVAGLKDGSNKRNEVIIESSDKNGNESPKTCVKSNTPDVQTNNTNTCEKNVTPQLCSNKAIAPIIDNNMISSLDGIRPLSLLDAKPGNEISINDNTPALSTECNFDPIIPLPSAHKNRPKLKPIPRFSVRRNSYQGSASESEDEIKKVKRDEPTLQMIVPNATPKLTPISTTNRNRNDSICSLPTDFSGHSNPILTPRQKVTKWRTGTSDGIRRAIARKRALQQAPENPLTMCDLIYYNPPNNSMKSNSVKKEVQPPNNQIEKPPSPLMSTEVEKETSSEPSAVPVPQVKIGPNGEIVIDEQSLVIETTDAIKSRTELSKLSVVYENGVGGGSGGLYRRASRSRDWPSSETLRFYKALNTIGTDFALMLSLFPGRTRKDLKVKFKKEEKHNLKLVNKALMNPLNFDISELEQQLINDQNVIEQRKKEKYVKKRKAPTKSVCYRKSSLALRSLDIGEEESDSERKPASISKKTIQKSVKNKLPKDMPTPPNYSSIPTSDAFEKIQTDASHLLPTDVEPGSMVILVNKIPKLPGHNTVQAYVAQLVNGNSKMVPVYLESNMLMSIAKEMNILKPGEKYTMATPERKMKPDC